jgi:hypothetical protein
MSHFWVIRLVAAVGVALWVAVAWIYRSFHVAGRVSDRMPRGKRSCLGWLFAFRFFGCVIALSGAAWPFSMRTAEILLSIGAALVLLSFVGLGVFVLTSNATSVEPRR